MSILKVWTDVNGRRMLAVSGNGHASLPVEDIVGIISIDEGKRCRIVSRYELIPGEKAMIVKHTYFAIEEILNDVEGNRNLLSDTCTRPAG